MKALILIADGRPDSQGQILHVSGLRPLPTEPVRVSFNYSTKMEDFVGLAWLTLEGDKVYADITLANKDDPRLQIPLCPSISGHTLKRTPIVIAESDVGGDVIVDLLEFEVTGVGVDNGPNADNRIEKVKLK